MMIRSLAIAGFALFTTVPIGARHAGPAVAAPAASTVSHPAPMCGGEPCDAVARGLVAFLDRRPEGLGGNGRSCADCHMPTSSFQLSPADVEVRYRLLQLLRLFNPKADDPLFRPIDADDFRVNGDQASDFSNLRKNGLVRIVFPLPPNVRLIDPATNLPSAEASVDIWRSVPSVLNVALSGPGSSNPWPREPNVFGGIPARCARRYAAGAGARCVRQSRAGATAARSAPARRLVVLSAHPVHETAGQGSRRRDPRGIAGAARSRSAAQRDSSSRARPSSNAPARSVMAEAIKRRRSLRFRISRTSARSARDRSIR